MTNSKIFVFSQLVFYINSFYKPTTLMTKSLRLISFLAFLCFFTSCKLSKYTAPHFTDLDKILALKPGLSLNEVNDVLKIKPYDIVYSHDKSKMLLIYNYRVKDRRMGLPTSTADQVMHSEDAQRQGEIWYNANYRELFILFEGEKLKSIYGEEVLSSAKSIVSMDSYLNGERVQAGVQGTNNTDLLFANSVYQDRVDKKKTQLEEDKQAKKRRNILLYGGGAGVLLLLNLLTR
jgi:hypothetical protein